MGRANTIQTNFTAGEISPKMYGRVDINKYFNGARKLRNMLVLPQGGTCRRPGTIYLGEVKDSTKATLLRPFVFSDGDSYVLEFGHQVVRIWSNDALVGAPLEVVTPYSSTELAQLKMVQSADVIFLAHPSYQPRVLTRVSHTSWTIGLYANSDGPYLSTYPDAVTMVVSSFTDLATATAPVSMFTTTGSTKNVTGAAAVSATDFQIRLTVTSHGYTTGQSVLVRGIVGVPEANGAWTIRNDSANTFTLLGSRIAKTSTYASGGTTIVSAASHVEYREDNVWKLAQLIDITSATVATVKPVAVLNPDSADKLSYDVHSSGATTTRRIISDAPAFGVNDRFKVVRPNFQNGSVTMDWMLIFDFLESTVVHGIPLNIFNYDNPAKEVVISARTITGTVTSSAAYFVSTDVGRGIRLKFGAYWTVGVISAYTSSTVVSATFENAVPVDSGAAYKLYNDGKTASWKISAWSETTGYPSSVSFHQQRLVFGGTTIEPSTLWMTMSGDYYSFDPSERETAIVTDAHAITITLVSGQVNKIRWLDSGPVLLVGTEGAEWQVKPSSIQQALTPTNLSATIQTSHGSMVADAVRVGSQTLFIQRSKRKLREMSYDFSIDAFANKDLSIISEHLLRENGGVVEFTNQKSPHNFLWIVLGNGKVASVTYEKEHEVVAWSLHDFGGSGIAESVAVIPSSDGVGDYVYFVVRRTINGVSKRFVERLDRLTDSTALTGYKLLDCSKSTDYGTPTDINTYAVAHLPAATVGRVVDGVYVGTTTVSSGSATVGYRGSSIYVGFTFESVVGILDPEGGSSAGSSQAKKKRVVESSARVENSYYFKLASATVATDDYELAQTVNDPVSGDRNRLIPAITLNAATPGGSTPYPAPTAQSVSLFSGDIPLPIDGAYDEGGRFEIVQDEPYNLHVDALMHKLNTNE